MAETNTARFGLRRWSADSDSFSRDELDDIMAKIEARGVTYLQGTRAARPAAGTGTGGSAAGGRFYEVVGDGTAANNGMVFYDNGTAWIFVGSIVEDAFMRASAAGTVALKVVAAAGQTADLQRWTANDGSILAKVDAAGNFTVAVLNTNGNANVGGALVVSGSATFAALSATSLQVSGAAQINQLRSSTTRADGQPKTDIRADGSIGRIDALIPVGTVVMSALAAAPSGWTLCDGGTRSRSSFPDLFAAIGTTYGAGDGSTTFNVPDFRQRFPIGAQTGVYPLGTPGGSMTHQLIAANLPPHAHAIDHDHASFTSGAVGDHSHTINHDHPSFNSGSVSDHQHVMDHDHGAVSTSVGGSHGHSAYGNTVDGAQNPVFRYGQFTGASQTADAIIAGGAHQHSIDLPNYTGVTGFNGAHLHSVDVPAFSGTSGVDGGHSHAVDVPAFAGSSGNGPGSSTAVSHIPSYQPVNFIMKV